MLYFTANTKKACKQGENLAEQVVVKVERFTDAAGSAHNRNIYSSKYAEGNPFGRHAVVLAPCDLEPGDEVDIDADDGVVLAVARGEARVWENDAKLEAQEAYTAARLAQRAAKQKQERAARGLAAD